MYGKRIRELRKEQNLTQQQLAAILRVDFRTVSCWEKERYEPNIEQIAKLCRQFGVTADYLLGIDDLV